MATTHARLLSLRFTRAQLETMLDGVLAEMTGGKTLIRWSAGDTSAERRAWDNSPPSQRATVIAQALSLLDPVAYPPDSVELLTRTRLIFRDNQTF